MFDAAGKVITSSDQITIVDEGFAVETMKYKIPGIFFFISKLTLCKNNTSHYVVIVTSNIF